jgi:catechol 2,3-dioxygenase
MARRLVAAGALARCISRFIAAHSCGTSARARFAAGDSEHIDREMTSCTHGASKSAVAADTLAFGVVHLNVTDDKRALGFWHDVVGLSVLEDSGPEVRLGVGERELVVLHPGAESGMVPGRSGLYHLAIHLPDEIELARALWRLIVDGYPQAPTDHTMSKSTYLSDPDGLGLELALETPERLGSWRNEAGRVELIDAEGNTHSIAEPLDVNELLANLPDRSFAQPLLPPGTKIGHLHLHVSELESALRFYRDLIGFHEHIYAPQLGFADLSAGGPFPHRLALNIWSGAGAPQPPGGSAGLRFFSIVLPGEEALGEVLGRLHEAGHESETVEGGELVRDPAGNPFCLTTESL